MIPEARWSFLIRIAVVAAGLIILFFSGIIPVEDYLSLIQRGTLTASVVPADIASLTNAQRTKEGLAPLTVNPLLAEAAQEKANDMAKNSYYAHVSPDGKSPLYWLGTVGYKYLNAGENLVIDRKTSEQAVDAWMNSPEHRENILRPQFTEIGVGVAKGRFEGQDTIYVVQEFGTPYPKTLAALPQPAEKPKSVTATSSNFAAIGLPTLPKATPKKVAVSTTTATTTSETGVATTTVVYTLAPEFYAPVSLPPSIPSDGTRVAEPEGVHTTTFLARVSNYIHRIASIFSL